LLLWDNLAMSVNRSGLYVGLMVLAAALAGYMVSRQLSRGAPVLQGGTLLPTPRPVAAFVLTDHEGAPFTNAQLAGQPSLVFFGFTHCPDVCPTTLALMAQLRREPAVQDLRLLFVTVDPGRDDVRTLKRYVDAFGGGIIGLRGEDAMLDRLLKNLGAIRSVQQRVGEDYTVDHSATLYYINRSGAMNAVFTPPFDYPTLLRDLSRLLP
jgi:protein SCO1